MLYFFITLAIGYLPPLGIYCVLIVSALRAFQTAFPCPAESTSPRFAT
jgi:hypothetical protein